MPARARTEVPASLAKLTRPALVDVFTRVRLHARLDEARKRPVVWVSAPPGAGKTTLVADWLERRKLRSTWYQVDEGDRDIATFFHYLRRAHPAATLPTLSPMDLMGPGAVAAFARRFFEELFAALPRPSVLVFDNYQELPSSPVQEIVRGAFAQLPEGVGAIVISRTEPPQPFARLQANNAISLVSAEELRLTPEEAAGISRQRGHAPSADDLATLHARTEGWAAGLILLLENGGLRWSRQSDATPQVLFDYFAGEVFAQLAPGEQDVLLRAAWLPKMTAPSLGRLSDATDARAVIGELHRRNYFTIRHADTEVFQFHPLFRTFLLARARTTLSTEALSVSACAAARLLLDEGEIADAVELLLGAHAWPDVTPVLVREAPRLAAEGRVQTLGGWLRRMPAEVLGREPWLLYWLGCCQLPFVHAEARASFERAFALFDAADDAAGLYLSWSGIIDTFHFEWRNFAPAGRWIPVFEDLRRRHPQFPSPEIEARAVLSIIIALVYLRPDHPEIPQWTERGMRLIQGPAELGYRLLLGGQLLFYSQWIGELGKAESILDLMEPQSDAKEAAPAARIAWNVFVAVLHWAKNAHAEALAAVKAGLSLAETSGVHVWDFKLNLQGAYAGLVAGDPDLTVRFLKAMAADLNEDSRIDRAYFHDVWAREAIFRGEYTRALEHAETALASAQDGAGPFAEANCQFDVAESSFALGRREKAFEHLRRAEAIASSMRSRLLGHMTSWLGAWFAFEEGREADGLELLGTSMRLAKERGFVGFLWWRPERRASLCAKALAAGIEVPFVQKVVRQCAILPEEPPYDVPAWPWRLRIETLGRFVVNKDDQPLVFKGKSQRKPLELLEVLIAFGGRDVASEKIIDALWPEADGAAGAHSLEMALHRLRKLLGHDGVIKVQDGRLSLDARGVGLDVWALERVLGRIEQRLKTAGVDESLETLEGELLRLCAGPFLDGSPEPWALAAREKLHSRINRTFAKLARHAESAGDLERAVRACRQGLELDPLAEELSASLMRALRRLGRPAEAVAVFDRSREAFSRLLGVEPSPELQMARDEVARHMRRA